MSKAPVEKHELPKLHVNDFARRPAGQAQRAPDADAAPDTLSDIGTDESVSSDEFDWDEDEEFVRAPVTFDVPASHTSVAARGDGKAKGEA
jgi:hypothetical protein